MSVVQFHYKAIIWIFFEKKIKNYYIIFSNKILDLNFGVYGIKSIEKGLIKLNQIESVRKSLSKEIKKLGKI